MAMAFSPISEISTTKESWSILAKIVRLWVVLDFTKHKIPFSIEMVLMDEQGVKIHATVRRTLVYKFQSELKEGSVYSLQFLTVAANVGSYRTCKHEHKLIFQISSKVQIMEVGRVSGDGFDLVPISEIFGGGYDMDYLVDVIGMLSGVGIEREYERNGAKTKLNVISLEADGHRIECTLFGTFVDELNSFLASGDMDNVVVIIQFAKVKTFQDKIHLQNCMACTKVIFNPSCEAAVQIKKRWIATLESPTQGISQLTETAKISIEEEFLELTPRTTVLGLKHCKQLQAGPYVVLATVKDVVTGTAWWYSACLCGKAVFPDSNMYFCEKCYKHVIKVEPRYCVKVRVQDSTGESIFAIFHKDACALFNKTAAELFEEEDKLSGNHGIPKEICELKGKTFLFKVEYKPHANTQFEQSFAVKKVCSDVSVMNKFKEMMQKPLDGTSESGSSGHRIGKMIDGGSSSFSEDLMEKFASAVTPVSGAPPQGPRMNIGGVIGCGEGSSVLNKGKSPVNTDDDDQSSEKYITPSKILSTAQITIDLSSDTDNLTPLKRQSPTEKKNDDLDVPLKMLKKNIKIEKE